MTSVVLQQAVGVKATIVRAGLGNINVFRGQESQAFQHMVDCSFADRLVFFVQSTASEDVRVQVIGADQDMGPALQAAVLVGDPELLPAGATGQQMISLTVDLQKDWHPWMGVMLTTLPYYPQDGGVIGAWAVYRQWEVV